MNEIDFHENLKQCAIYSYGKNLTLPANYQATNNYVNPKSGFSSSVIINAVKSYLGKTLNEMTKEEIDELVADNI